MKNGNLRNFYILTLSLLIGLGSTLIQSPLSAQSLPLQPGFFTNAGQSPAALLNNPKAVQKFNSLSPAQQNTLIKKYAPATPAGVAESPAISPETGASGLNTSSAIPIRIDPSIWTDSKTGLKRFGYEVFQQALNADFSKGSIPVNPGDYQLGSGDVLTVRVWGKLDDTFEVPIQRDGRAFVPKVGFLGLSGLTVDRASQLIRKELDRMYANIQIQVSLTQLRPVTVFVLGEVARPGAVDLSGLNTAFSALYAAGGPNISGSLRKIVLKRGGRTIRTIDFYHYLLKGELGQDLRLEAGDTLFVPSVGDNIGVNGNVKRPALFEIQGPVSLYDAIMTYSGGFSADSYRKRIQINRIENGERKVLMDVVFGSDADFRSRSRRILLKSGDIVQAIPILDLEHNTLTIQGHIQRPGKYQFRSGMTVQELINLAEGPKSRLYTNRIEIQRYISDTQKELLRTTLKDAAGFTLKEWDDVKLFSQDEVEEKREITVWGDIPQPGKYPLSQGMKLLDVYFMVSKSNPSNLPISRIEWIRLEGTQNMHVEIDAQTLIRNPDSTKNITLEPQDVVTLRVFTQNQLRRVDLTGEVAYPGTYWVEPHFKLSDLIQRAGGLTEKAFLNGTQFYRNSVKDRGYEHYSKILEEEKRRLTYDLTNQVQVGSTENANTSLMFLEDILAKNKGRVFINVKNQNELITSGFNLELEESDRIIIPAVPAEIQVLGGIMQRSALTFKEGETAQFYIERAGGLTEFADSGSIYVMKANGYVIKNPSSIERGDVLYIPERAKLRFDVLDFMVKTSQVLFNLAAVYRIFL
jgi:polysaccharide export outer membrane protein